MPVLILLLGSYFAPYVKPTVYWPVAFLGLAYMPLVIFAMLFTIYFSWKKRRRAVLSGIVVISGFSLFTKNVQFTQPDNISATVKNGHMPFNVMTYNTKLFDLYNWSHNETTRQKMFAQLKNANPDILCMQEFFNCDTGKYNNVDSLRNKLGYDYQHVEYTLTLRKNQHFGIITCSRYPIVNKGSIVFNNRSNNICIYTDMLVAGDTVRVYNMHLQSIRFGYADKQFIDALTSAEDAENEIENSKNILRRIKRAYTKRAGQAESIAAHIATCRYPVIVCGDFNDTPNSFAYETISENLEDAFLECGYGYPRTFSAPLPLPRIDYLLYSKSFTASDYMIDEKEYSDHYPVSCVLRKKNTR